MRSVVEACWVHSIEIERASFTGNVNSGLSLLAKIRRDGVAECCDGFGLYFRNHGEQMTTRSFATVKGFADDFENLIFVELARICDGLRATPRTTFHTSTFPFAFSALAASSDASDCSCGVVPSPLDRQRPAKYVFSRHVEEAVARLRPGHEPAQSPSGAD